MSSRSCARPSCVARPDINVTVVIARDDIEVASWSLESRPRADLSLIDELARLQLVARRLGCSLRLRGAWPELCELLDLAGLAEVPTCGRGWGLEVREPDDGKRAGVDECTETDDQR